MSKESKNVYNGIGFTGALQLLFITLKLCNVIHWSWWWVLSPTLFWAIVVIVLASIILFIGDE